MNAASYLSLCLFLLAGAASASPRAEFTAALREAEAGQSAGEDSAALRTYLLYPYVQAVRLRQRLLRQPDEVIDVDLAQYLQQHSDLPVSRDLRRDWLLSLAERQQWGQFLAHYSEAQANPALRCHRLKAWLETGGGDNLRADALQQWMTGEQLPQACKPAFEWLQEQGDLDAVRKLQRARLALESGNAELAEWLLKSADPQQADPLINWIRLLRNPREELHAIASRPQLLVEWNALRNAYAKISRSNVEQAQALLPQLLQSRSDETERQELRLLTALALSWDRLPQAIAAFQEVPETALDPRGHEWRVRAALWQRDWALANSWLARMPTELAQQPRWRYWHARTLELIGQPNAQAEYQKVQGNNWYALLAAHRLGAAYTPRTTVSADDAATQKDLQARPALKRALELFALGRIEWANSEWNLLTADLNSPQLIQAARIAARAGWTLQAASGWKKAAAPDDLDILYPLAYQDEMHRAAQQAGISPAWISGIARQESLFLPQARSRSDALGLMQVKLDTAHHVAKRSKQALPRREEMFDPAVNAPIGAAYLAEMLDRFNGRLPLAIGAYNAGPNAVARWLPEQPVDAEIWMENVPYNETRDYIQKVLWNAAYYGARSSGKPVDVAPWLQPIGKALDTKS